MYRDTPKIMLQEAPATKMCGHCKVVKPLEEFHRSRRSKTGRMSSCKTCRRAYAETPQAKVVQLRGNRKYLRTPRGREVQGIQMRKHLERYPERIKARNAVAIAVKDGRLPRASTLLCSCGDAASHYHHYLGHEREHWLDVIPLCPLCHNGKRTLSPYPSVMSRRKGSGCGRMDGARPAKFSELCMEAV